MSETTTTEADVGADAERMRRAEAKIDELGERTGRFVVVTGHKLLRFAARAREEAEDLLAEAQSIRDSRRGG